MSERSHAKVYAVFVAFCLVFIVIIVRAFFIQVVNKKKLLVYSESQLLREAIIFPNRGNIYDRKGHPLSINVQTYNIFSIPRIIKDRQETLGKLAKIVPGLTVKKIYRALKGRNRFTWIERKIELDDNQVANIKKLKGIFLEKTTKRFYPNHELMGQILGFVGVDNIGLGGVEYQFNELLKGDAKRIKYLQDAKGRPIKFETYDTESKAGNLYLTLDKDLQAVTEKYLRQAIEEHQAIRGGVGVLDADNGEILAMAHYPFFDPNQVKHSKQDHRRPSFVTDPFEPGSVFKIFTVLSAMENKMVTSETNYFCEYGRLEVGGHVIKESDTTKKYEWLSVTDIIKYSSNIGIVKMAFDLTFPLLNETLEKFGFGKKTNIELPGESRGIYNNTGKVSKLSLSNLGFGQGVATTGIQILSAYAAIVNGGVFYNPTIVKSDSERPGKRVISSDIARELQEMLLSVVESGTAQSAKIPHFKIAGKTGTAQKPDGRGGYSGYISNFVGFPMGVDKKVVVYAYIDDPQGEHYYGSKVAAPLVKKIIEYILFKNKEYQNIVLHEEELNHIDYNTVSHGRDISSDLMPSFIGLDKRSSSTLAHKIGVYIKHQGRGVVVRQNKKVGEPYAKNDIIILEHEPPQYE